MKDKGRRLLTPSMRCAVHFTSTGYRRGGLNAYLAYVAASGSPFILSGEVFLNLLSLGIERRFQEVTKFQGFLMRSQLGFGNHFSTTFHYSPEENHLYHFSFFHYSFKV